MPLLTVAAPPPPALLTMRLVAPLPEAPAPAITNLSDAELSAPNTGVEMQRPAHADVVARNGQYVGGNRSAVGKIDGARIGHRHQLPRSERLN